MRITKLTIVLGAIIVAVGAAFAFSVSMQKNPPVVEGEWSTYVDEDFNYQIDYPSRFDSVPTGGDGFGASKKDLVEDGGVSFANGDAPGPMGVKVYVNPSVTTLEAWLAAESQQQAQASVRVEVEKVIDIDGHEAWVTYPVYAVPGSEESFIQEKKTMFFKDGILYQIWTKFYDDENDHARAWESFRFMN